MDKNRGYESLVQWHHTGVVGRNRASGICSRKISWRLGQRGETACVCISSGMEQVRTGTSHTWGLRKEEEASGWSPALVSYSIMALKWRHCVQWLGQSPSACPLCDRSGAACQKLLGDKNGQENFILRFAELGNTLRRVDLYQFTSFCHKPPLARRPSAVCWLSLVLWITIIERRFIKSEIPRHTPQTSLLF